MKINIGYKSNVMYGVYISGTLRGPKIKIGSNSVINRFVYLDGRGELTIGNNVNISHYSIIHTLDHDPQSPEFNTVSSPVIIEDHTWLGSGCIILPGIIIGEGAVVGAGSVVTKNVLPYTIVAGNPARKVGKRNKMINYKSKYFPYFDSDIQ